MLRAFAFLLAFLAAASATGARASDDMGTVSAHPVLWTVHGKGGTVYLLGSLHLLPANVAWHTPEIDTALAASDVFVFEAPTDASGQAEAAQFVAEHGTLPRGEALSHLLPPSALPDYAYAIETTHVAPELIDTKEPWLAALIFEVALMREHDYDPANGIDRQVFGYAAARGRNVRYFESVKQQLTLIAPKDGKLAIDEFVTDLREFRHEHDDVGAIVTAWEHGDVATIDRLMNSELAKEPEAKKALLDDRNRAWIARLDRMLAEKKTFFVTVGCAHLAGPTGVPALLRAQGYQVEGP